MIDVDENTLFLGIETSCDETAAALVMGGNDVVSSVVSSQVELHAEFGGVVPEVASRAHLGNLNPVVARAIVEAGVDESRIDAIASTCAVPIVPCSCFVLDSREAKSSTVDSRMFRTLSSWKPNNAPSLENTSDSPSTVPNKAAAARTSRVVGRTSTSTRGSAPPPLAPKPPPPFKPLPSAERVSMRGV